jgi:DNA-binding XRE family transcriptional regulator
MTLVSAEPAPRMVKRARKTLNLTQVEFAQRLGLSRYTIMRFEAGDPVPETTKLAIRYLLDQHEKTAESSAS